MCGQVKVSRSMLSVNTRRPEMRVVYHKPKAVQVTPRQPLVRGTLLYLSAQNVYDDMCT